jgi:hypothetical protein
MFAEGNCGQKRDSLHHKVGKISRKDAKAQRKDKRTADEPAFARGYGRQAADLRKWMR